MASTPTSADKVFFAVSMSLDGYIAPAGMDLEHADDPSHNDWGRQWAALQSWLFPQRFFRENLNLGEGGETGPDNDMAQEVFERTGASILGKRMFDGGERFWPEQAPFHAGLCRDSHRAGTVGAPRWHYLPLHQGRHRVRSGPSPGGRWWWRHPDRRRSQPHPAVPQRRAGGRVHYLPRARSPGGRHSAIRLHRVRTGRPAAGRHRPLTASDPPEVCSQPPVAPEVTHSRVRSREPEALTQDRIDCGVSRGRRERWSTHPGWPTSLAMSTRRRRRPRAGLTR